VGYFFDGATFLTHTVDPEWSRTHLDGGLRSPSVLVLPVTTRISFGYAQLTIKRDILFLTITLANLN